MSLGGNIFGAISEAAKQLRSLQGEPFEGLTDAAEATDERNRQLEIGATGVGGIDYSGFAEADPFAGTVPGAPGSVFNFQQQQQPFEFQWGNQRDPFAGTVPGNQGFDLNGFYAGISQNAQRSRDTIEYRRQEAERQQQQPAPGNSDYSSWGGDGDASQASGIEGTEQWRTLMDKAAAETGTPWQVLAAIMGIESGGNPQAVGGDNEAFGLMQITKVWEGLVQKYGGDYFDPWTSIRVAADILKMGYDQYGSWEKAAAFYFGGGGAFNDDGSYSDNADSYGTNIGNYVNRFNNNMAALGYGQGAAPRTGQPRLDKALAAGLGLTNGGVFPVQGYTGQMELHWGENPGAIDLFAAEGTPVISLANGVMTSGYSDVGGYWAMLQGDDGLQYYYAHMQGPAYSGRVTSGQQIGAVGETGNAAGTGAHLHLGIGNTINEGSGPAGGAGDIDVIAFLNSRRGTNRYSDAGLVQYAFSSAGVALPGTAQAQFNATQRVDRSQTAVGDLLFFSMAGGGGVDRVAIFLGNGQMLLTSPETGAARVVEVTDEYMRYLAGVGRVQMGGDYGAGHTGVDAPSREGARVNAVRGGTVLGMGDDPDIGHYVAVFDGHRFYTYGHLDRDGMTLKAGDYIEQGDTIAKVGMTGKTSGPHVHLDVHDLDGKALDPFDYF